jgi:phosphatidate cytidylyltransferase
VLRQRIVTAVVLLAVFLAAAAAGRWALDAILAVLIGAATFEWLRLAQHSWAISMAAAVAFAGALLAAETYAAWPEPGPRTILGLAVLAWLSIVAIVLRGAQRGVRLPHPLSTALAFLLLAAAWLSLMRLLDAGFVSLLSVLVIVWVADVAAYFAGRQWGRRKLAPAISPGKTWAGVGGAVVAVLLVASLFALVAPDLQVFSTLLQQRLPLAAALAVLAALVGLSIVGDLFESLLKRQANVKDSGRMLPGHGGVLDRVDAMIAVLPAAALIDLWLRG